MKYKLYPCKNPNAETIILSSGLGGHAQFWNPQIDSLIQYFHVFVYDHIGITNDSSNLPQGYSVNNMAQELNEMLVRDKIKVDYFIGHALGAFIGVELALQTTKLKKLILINPWAKLDPHTQRCFNTRLKILDHVGVDAYIQAQALFLYPPEWISMHDHQLQQQEIKMIQHSCSKHNIKMRLNALRNYIPKDRVQLLDIPCYILSNRDDFLVPWQQGLKLSKFIQNSFFKLLETGGHASTVTQPIELNTEILNILTSEQ
ncbi:pyrimidine utilization protein D [Acinetobacter nectaris CIP 110549]|uniref:Pyrimidine utilization protein D n=1 Tax=Acinetobacter nectaris CIP 110549 TaxID=1392540 RepID=V2TLC3_9GAMM|nr:pyrimidine utilization protein D [Acinetobacter nectaris]ESK36600.1 pyrimidine utilization protein D [Acinetobacter nectaris CIP 110549]